MKAQLAERLSQLKEEFGKGRQLLMDFQRQESNLKATLLRLSGAIQVIEEELDKVANRNGVGESENAV